MPRSLFTYQHLPGFFEESQKMGLFQGDFSAKQSWGTQLSLCIMNGCCASLFTASILEEHHSLPLFALVLCVLLFKVIITAGRNSKKNILKATLKIWTNEVDQSGCLQKLTAETIYSFFLHPCLKWKVCPLSPWVQYCSIFIKKLHNAQNEVKS